ncbi:MAG: hypothetical protein IIC67_00445 [Thaumarchaeota archaeon]|nr:hypothetical protein [Nitrososphaerota archaeon]
MVNYHHETVLKNIEIMEEKGFGKKRTWNKLKKKLRKKQDLEDNEFQYFITHSEEYSNALKNKRKWLTEQVQMLKQKNIGNEEKWDILIQKLQSGENLYGEDLEYYHDQHKKFSLGVSNQKEHDTDPLAIIKIRLAKGEITSDEYDNLSEKLRGIVKPDSSETMFWVCPHCGNDTQMKDGRQYCTSCKIYLSI